MGCDENMPLTNGIQEYIANYLSVKQGLYKKYYNSKKVPNINEIEKISKLDDIIISFINQEKELNKKEKYNILFEKTCQIWDDIMKRTNQKRECTFKTKNDLTIISELNEQSQLIN